MGKQFWELECSRDGAPADKLLAEGWEPFAVTAELINGEQIWWKRMKYEEPLSVANKDE